MGARPMADVPTKTPESHSPEPVAQALTRPDLWVLIPCAGTGSRTGLSLPKQYQPVAGKALVLHTLGAFEAVLRIRQTLLLLAPDDRWFATLETERFTRCTSVACGASTRAGTVARGLDALRARGARAHDWVLVHDAARCLVTPALIDRLIDACLDDPVGGLLAVPVSDTLKLAAGDRVAATVDRSRHWLAQTPQMFRLEQLQHALREAGDAVTDEASAIEATGQSPRLVSGDPTNFKVTVAQDFVMAQSILKARGAHNDEELAYDYP